MISEWVNLILNNSILVEPKEKFNILRDVGDNKFLECAHEGKVDYIITQDNHLLNLKKFRDTKIINPEDFLELFK